MWLRPHKGERVPTRDGGQLGRGLLQLLFMWVEISAGLRFDLWSSLLSLGNRNELRLLSLTRSLDLWSSLLTLTFLLRLRYASVCLRRYAPQC